MTVLLGVYCAILVFWVASSNYLRTRRLHQLDTPSLQLPQLGTRASWFAATLNRIESAFGSEYSPHFVRNRLRRRHEAAVEAQLPFVVDLFRLAIGSGMNIAMALQVVSSRTGGPLGSLLQATSSRCSKGVHTSDALQEMVISNGQGLRLLVEALQASGRFGSPLNDSLARLGGELRLQQGRKAEQRAKKLSVQLLFPLAGCVLPAFALLAIVPLLAGSMSTLASSFS